MALPNPLAVLGAARAARRIVAGGGAQLVRLEGISGPDGWIATSVAPELVVVAFDGTVERFSPAVPVPFPYAWAWRLSRRLGVPLVSSVEPSRVHLELPLPRLL